MKMRRKEEILAPRNRAGKSPYKPNSKKDGYISSSIYTSLSLPLRLSSGPDDRSTGPDERSMRDLAGMSKCGKRKPLTHYQGPRVHSVERFRPIGFERLKRIARRRR